MFWTSQGSGVAPSWVDAFSILLDGVDERLTGNTNLNSYLGRNNAWSFSFWGKSGASGLDAVFDTQGGSPTYVGQYCILINNDFYVGQSEDYGGGNTQEGYWPGVVTAGVWIHYLFCYSGSGSVAGYKLFVNGVDKGAATINSNGLTGAAISITNMSFGSLVPGNLPYAGNIDELAFFSADKSAAAAAIYNGGVPINLGAISNCVAYWRMGDGDTYPTLTDQKGLMDLTMVNMEPGDIVTDVP